MRDDYRMDGVFVRDLPTPEIHDAINGGVEAVDGTEDTPDNRSAMLDRLRIELIIRRIMS